MYTGLSDWNGNLVGHLKLTLSVLYTVVVDSQSSLGEDPARGRVRHLKGFRVEVNGPLYCIGLIFKFGDLLGIKVWMTLRWRDTVNKNRVGNLGFLYICLKDIRVAEILTK